MARTKLDFRMYRNSDEHTSLTESIRNNQIIYSTELKKVLIPIGDNTFILSDDKYFDYESIKRYNEEIRMFSLSNKIISEMIGLTENVEFFNFNEVNYAANSADFNKLKAQRRNN